jgi:hypothetical protein
MAKNKPPLRVIVRARENGGYRYQILAVGSAAPRPVLDCHPAQWPEVHNHLTEVFSKKMSPLHGIFARWIDCHDIPYRILAFRAFEGA